MPRIRLTSDPYRARSTPNLSNLYTIVEREEQPIRFESYSAIKRLEAVLGNPNDTFLLHEMTRRYARHKEPGLSAIWAFAMTKGGAMPQNWRAGEPWQPMMVEDLPDGFFPNDAYQHLHDHLPKQKDKEILHDLRKKNEDMEEAASWAIWQLALKKGQDSSRAWRLDQNAARARELMGETAPARKGLWTKLRGRFQRHRSPLPHQLRSLLFCSTTSGKNPTSSSQSHPQEPQLIPPYQLPDLNSALENDLSSSSSRCFHLRPTRASRVYEP